MLGLTSFEVLIGGGNHKNLKAFTEPHPVRHRPEKVVTMEILIMIPQRRVDIPVMTLRRAAENLGMFAGQVPPKRSFVM
jgi:hypothetical protein